MTDSISAITLGTHSRAVHGTARHRMGERFFHSPTRMVTNSVSLGHYHKGGLGLTLEMEVTEFGSPLVLRHASKRSSGTW